MLVACSVWLLTLPVLLANLVIAYVDLHNGPGTFGGTLDGDVGIFAQVAWVVEQPQIYAFAIPALGILGSVAGVVAGVRPARHGLSMGLIGFFGLVSVGAWSQPAFQGSGGVAYDEKFVFIAFGIAALLPVLAVIGSAADTLLRGRANLSGLPPAHLMGALGGALVLLTGVAGGVARVIEPFALGDRITVSGVMNLVLFGAIGSALAGVWFWATKISGRALSPVLGRMVALDLVGGALLLGGAQVINGLFETQNDPLAPVVEDAGDALNIVSMLGGLLVALGVLGVLAALAQALRGTPSTDADPWGGQTLEWATTTPPPTGNFAEPPATVTSEAPLLDAAFAEGEESR
jgi:heme/copper-type cytochrome/quinol oxidase subunit 1